MRTAPGANNSQNGESAPQRPWAPLLAVVGIPLLTLLLASVSYVTGIGAPSQRIHQGVLLPPGLHVDLLGNTVDGGRSQGYEHRWLLYLDRAGCAAACDAVAAGLKQVQLALGRDRERVLVKVLGTGRPLDSPLDHWRDAHYPGQPLVLLADPLGNLVLAYAITPQLEQRVLQDLKRLLRASKIG